MKINKAFMQATAVVLVLFMAVPPGLLAQESKGKPVFKQEELDQMLAPIALYPDSLLAQILMASTYPLEVVEAARWAKKNKDLKGDALTSALEKEDWDASVKSLVNFPQVLDMMNEKLDWTQKLGDAFLAQQKDVMDTVQKLRKKAEAEGNLKSTKEQKVVVEKETIIIESANPQVVYVPTYNPTVVYGAWAYPSYPPYYYYPPGYVAGAALFSFGVGMAVGAAWGYAWGGCNWGGGNVDIDIDRNTNINRNINRDNYKQKAQQRGQSGKGAWQHDASHRKGASYRDQGTAQKFNRGTSSEAAKSREQFRGRAEAGRQDISRGGADQFKGRQDAGGRDISRGGADRGGSAFSGMDRGGASTRDMSSRGASSRQSMSSGGGGGSRGGGGFSGGGGGSRGGGGGGRSGGGGGRR